MYIHPDMIDLGLLEGQSWPSDQHRGLAQTLYLCNPTITTRYSLTDHVQSILDSNVTEKELADFQGTIGDLHKFCESKGIIFAGVFG